MSLSELPFEVLSHIFSFLSVRSKENVRLTCVQWYNACIALPVLKSEKMVIEFSFSDEDCNTLMNSTRLCFDIEFRCLHFDEYSSSFWKECGPRIELLRLYKCSFEKESAYEMIKSCNNLKELRIDACRDINVWHHCMPIPNVNEFRICHKSLVSLTLKTCHNITDFDFSFLFNTYSCIRSFALIDNSQVSCHKRVDSRFYKPDIQNFDSDAIFSFSCIFSKIKLNAEIINKIVLDRIGINGITDSWLEDIGSLPVLKLKELTLNDHQLLSERVFLKFFSTQIDIECVRINKCQNFSLKCFLHMIRNCSNLKSIDVESLYMLPNFLMSKEIFLALMLRPNLKYLKLTGCFFMEENVNCLASISITGFQNLRHLILVMPPIYYDIFIPRIPSNLSSLHLIDKSGNSGLTDANLQLIFDKYVNLHCLNLTLDSEVSDFGFTGSRKNCSENQVENSGISINRLKNLMNLSLAFNKYPKTSITEATFSLFVFPNLKILTLYNFSALSEKSFALLTQNNPWVEYFEYVKPKISAVTVSKICDQWKNLRRVRLNIDWSDHVKSQKMFNIRPGMKFIPL